MKVKYASQVFNQRAKNKFLSEMSLILSNCVSFLTSNSCNIRNGKINCVALSVISPHMKLWHEIDVHNFVHSNNNNTIPPSLKNAFK